MTAPLQEAIELATTDRSNKIEAKFPNRDRWFQRPISIRLSRLVRAVRQQPAYARPLAWVTLAETARLSSNTRTSTFKLHRRAEQDLKHDRKEPVSLFRELASRNIAALASQSRALRSSGLLTQRGTYRPGATAVLGDTRHAPWPSGQWADAMMTSPPYGDNVSTVTYGQAAYLPLQWVDLGDVGASKELLASTHEIDARSLGGSLRHARSRGDALRDRSASLALTLDRLGHGHPPDRLSRVAAFCDDLDAALAAAMLPLRPLAPMIITLGDRMVGGGRVPTASIVKELLETRGARHLETVERAIPSYRKRHPLRNSISETINAEATLIFAAPAD